jgi:hypothetical protein
VSLKKRQVNKKVYSARNGQLFVNVVSRSNVRLEHQALPVTTVQQCLAMRLMNDIPEGCRLWVPRFKPEVLFPGHVFMLCIKTFYDTHVECRNSP